MFNRAMTTFLRDDEPRPRSAGAFRQEVCLPFLLEAQNADGGWGYRPGQRSAVEPAGWALLALEDRVGRNAFGQAIRRGLDWLRAVQLPDGSWPAYAGQAEGCWTTALAGLALHVHGEAQDAVAKGFAWLCDSWPGEGTFWRRLQMRLSRASRVVRQDPSLRGWSWTPGTSSWVEPTAYALVLLQRLYPDTMPRRAEKRRRLAEAMLYDRMCPGGGWNSGNPYVYGVAGESLVGPTVWALLALRNHRERAENRKSLDWLANACQRAQGPGSLALAHLCLEIYGQPAAGLESALRNFYDFNGFLQSVPVAAWAAMALEPGRWLRGKTRGARDS
jgi:hypothetical protein